MTTRNWFVTVVLPENAPGSGVNYTLEVTLSGPSFASLTLPATTNNNLTPFSEAGLINYYSVALAEGSNAKQLNLTVSAIEGGKVTLSYAFDEPPFFSCLPETVGCTTNTSCTIIIDTCLIPEQQSTLYVGVMSGALAVFNRGIIYTLNAEAISVPATATLQQGNYAPSQISQAQYQHYEFSAKNYDVESDTWLSVHLYSDNTVAKDLTLYVNYNDKAGADGSCYENFASCEISTALGSCTVQITPCDFNDHDDWYFSVYSSSGSDVYNTPTKFTLFAQLEDPVELEESYLAIPAVLNPSEYDHYYISSDKISAGAVWIVHVDNLANQPLTIYEFEGNLAGDVCTSDACYNNTLSQNNPTNFEINFCDPEDDVPTEDLYLSIFAPATNKNSAPYDITLIPYPYTTVPTATLSDSNIYIGSIDPSQTQNFSVSLDKKGEDNIEFVVTITLVTDSNSGLKITLANTTYLQCATYRTVKSGTVDSDTNTLSIVVDPCDFEYSDGFFVIVENLDDDSVLHYNLEVNENEISVNALSNTVYEVSTVGQNQVQRFSYAPKSPNKNDSLVIEVYFDSQPNVQGQLFVSTENQQCIDNPICTDNYKCVYVVNSCELVFKTLYIYVSTKSTLNAASPLRFTIRASEQSAFIPFQLGTPAPFSIYPTQKIYHTFTVSTTPGNVVYLELSNTQGASIEGRLSPTSVPSTCPCYKYTQSIAVAPWADVIVPLEYCDLTSTTWTLLVETTGNIPPNQIVSYTLNIYEFLNTTTSLVASTPVDSQVNNGEYAFFSIPAQNDPNSANQVTLQISNIRGGLLTIFGSDSSTKPPTKSCSLISENCSLGSATCSIELTTCLSTITQFSVLGASSAVGPVFFTIQYVSKARTALNENVPSSLTTIPRDYVMEYSYNVVAGSVFPLVSIKVNVTAGSLSLFVSGDSCLETVFAATTCNNQNCLIPIPYCELDGVTALYITATGASNESNYSISANTVDLNSKMSTYTTAVDVTVPVGTYVTYNVKYASAAPTTNLDVFTASAQTTPNRGLSVYYGFSATAAAPPVCNTKCTLNTCSFVRDACCIEEGYYSVTFYNGGTSDQISSLTMGSSTVGTLSTQTFPLNNFKGQTAAPKTYPQTIFTFEDNTYSYPELDLAIFSLSASADANTNFYLRAEGYAGLDTYNDECFDSSLPPSCLNTQSCTVQYFPCKGDTIHNTYYFSAESVSATTGNFAVNSTFQMPTSLVPSTPLPGQYLTAGLQTVYQITLDSRTIIDNLNVTISLTSGSVSAYLTRNAPRSCPNAVTAVSCTGNTLSTCTFAAPFQASKETLFVNVIAGTISDAAFTITATPITVLPNTLVSQTPVTISRSAVTTSYYSFYVDNPVANTVVSVQVSGAEGVSQLSWAFSTMGSFVTPSASCAQGSCGFDFGSCDLPVNTTLIFRVTNIANANYSIVATQSSQTPVSIGLHSYIENQVTVNGEVFYSLDISATDLMYGQSLVISLENQCGTSELFLSGPNAIASTLCHDGNAVQNSVTISSCTIISSGLPYKYVTVHGVTEAFSDFDLPIRYNLSTSVSGDAFTFEIIDDNTVNVNSASKTFVEYIFPVDGAGISAGSTSFIFQLPDDMTGNAGGISIALDEPHDCASTFKSCTPATGQSTCSVSFDSCDLNAHRQLYIRFNSNSPVNSSFIVQRSNPYIRDWNDEDDELDTIEYGSVSKTLYENYVITELDDLEDDDFLFQLTLNHTAGSNTPVTVAVSQIGLPGDCSGGANPLLFTCSATLGNTCTVEIEACTLIADYPIYISVYTNSNQLEQYQLSLEQSVDVRELEESEEICVTLDSSDNDIAYFSFEVAEKANAAYVVNVFAVETSSVQVYIKYESIATSSCHVISQQVTEEAAIEIIGKDVAAGTTVFVTVRNNRLNGPNSFFIEWESVTISPATLTLNVPTTVTPTVSTTNYFTISIPTQTANAPVVYYISLDSSDDNAIVTYNYNSFPSSTNITLSCGLGTNCTLYEGCTLLGQGGVTNLDLVVVVGEKESFTILVGSNPINQVAYTPETLVGDSLMLNEINSYTFTLSELGLDGISLFNLEVGNVVGGEITVWITSTAFKRDDGACIPASSTINKVNSGSIAESFCVTRPNVPYFINVRASKQTSSCTPVSFSLSLWSFNVTHPQTALQLGTAAVLPFGANILGSNTNDFTFTAPTYDHNYLSYITVHYDLPAVVENNDITSSFTPSVSSLECYDTFESTDFYVSGCYYASGQKYNMRSVIEAVTVPGLNFSVTVNGPAAAQIPEFDAATTVNNFVSSPFAFWYFNRTSFDDTSLEIQLEVITGPAIDVEVLVTDCALDVQNVSPFKFTCYTGTCVVPFSWSSFSLDLEQTPIYTVILTGQSGATYKIGYESGKSNCKTPLKGSLEFCSDVDYAIWDNSTSLNHDALAAQRFDQLYLAFCPPCTCRGLSSSCNDTLKKYACDESFPACDSDGFQSPVCLATCTDVVDACGKSFSQVGLNDLDCSHNFYLVNEKVCQTYGAESGSSNTVWIILGVLAGIVLLVILAALAYFIYYKVKAGKTPDYEQI